ncbi:hypothetical protein [Bradyrhizobium sp. DASA03007]|uniref:hypothetical protein n=1 Tax=unclassified Bradyrhizobium TaxID=2631580 RepID=UPI003F706966
MTKSYVDPSYINRCSIEELRRMLIDSLEFEFGLIAAIRSEAEIPSGLVLSRLGQAGSWPEDSTLGKLVQRKLGLDAVPPVSECESGAGVWWRILQGLKTPRPEELP